MWLNKYRLSYSCYKYCCYVKDDPIIRKGICSSWCAYWYCINVKDDPEVRKYINITNEKGLMETKKELERIRNVAK